VCAERAYVRQEERSYFVPSLRRRAFGNNSEIDGAINGGEINYPLFYTPMHFFSVHGTSLTTNAEYY